MRRFLTLCFQIAVIIGCGYFLVFIHDLPDPSPAPSPPLSSSPARQQKPALTLPVTPHPPRPHTRRVSSAPVSSSRDGGIFSDQNILHHSAGVIIYGSLAVLVVYLLWRAINEFRDCGEWTAFFPLLTLAVLIGGAWSWFRYFGDHGGFLIWPIVVSLVVIALVLVRALVLDRQQKERAEKMRQFPAPPDLGGPAKKSDFKDW